MISSCFEVVGALGRGEGIKQVSDFLPERIDGAVGGLFEQSLELILYSKEVFDGVDVGGVRPMLSFYSDPTEVFGFNAIQKAA